MPLALFAICIFFTLKEPSFIGPRNLTQLIVEFSITGTLALGMFLVLLTGQIDLSVGSGLGLIGGVAAVLIFHYNIPAYLALTIGLILAITVWTLMGLLIVKQKIPSFIITLGGLLIFKGFFWLIIQNSTIPVSRGDVENIYSKLTTYYLPHELGIILACLISALLAYLMHHSRVTRREHHLAIAGGLKSFSLWLSITLGLVGLTLIFNHFRGVPLTLLVLVCTASSVYFLTQHTVFGRSIYAIGGNTEAAVLSGINVTLITTLTYTLMGAAVALTGFMTTAYSGASTTTVGELMELDAIAACVIGGTALRGGRGTVAGVICGALVMATLLNGMTLIAVAPEVKFIARGTVLALAVWIDVRLSKK